VLAQHGIETTRIPNADQSKANLYATVGPTDKPGVMLSGHTDVVPVDGQKWNKPPFTLTEDIGRYYGRGTADMKGFVACALNAAVQANKKALHTPLHLAFSYDEEIGCVGVRSLIALLQEAPIKPALCIVGEPTELRVATRHKGKISALARCVGRPGHSALAPKALNAIHIATDLVVCLREVQQKIASQCTTIDATDVPYTTVHVGGIHAGQALNIVPELCTVNFEIRNAASDDADTILDEIRLLAEQITAQARQKAPEAGISIDVLNAYPGLNAPANSDVVTFVKSLVGANDTSAVAFGTEGGLFSQQAGIPTVVCGPGSMDQGHKPDEYIEIDQIARCDKMLERLVVHLTAP